MHVNMFMETDRDVGDKIPYIKLNHREECCKDTDLNCIPKVYFVVKGNQFFGFHTNKEFSV